VIETLGCTEQMSRRPLIHQQILVRAGTQATSHDQQATHELRQGQLELANQNPAWSGHRKTNAVGTSR
jgi:hypothetical protein